MTLKGKRGGKTPSQPEAQPWVIRIQYESKAFISQKTKSFNPVGIIYFLYITFNIYNI